MRTRNKMFVIRLTDDELQSLDDKVSKSGLSREEFVRIALSGVQLKEAPPIEYPELIIQLRRVGSNINQLLKLANAKGIIISNELRIALENNRKIEKELWKAVTIGK